VKRLGFFVAFALVLAACGSGGGSSLGTAHGPDTGMGVHRRAQTATTAQGASGGDTTPEAGPRGPSAAVVPDVKGLSFVAAVHRLWRHGITFGPVYARNDNAPLWSVIEIDPGPGQPTPVSGKVNLTISLHRLRSVGVIGTMRCQPYADNLSDPNCLGKLLKYSAT
jgi:hypothetical protein